MCVRVHMSACVFKEGVDIMNQQQQEKDSPWHVSHIYMVSFIHPSKPPPKKPFCSFPLTHKQTSTSSRLSWWLWRRKGEQEDAGMDGFPEMGVHQPFLIGCFIFPRWKNTNKMKRCINVIVHVRIGGGGRHECVYVGASIRYGDQTA